MSLHLPTAFVVFRVGAVCIGMSEGVGSVNTAPVEDGLRQGLIDLVDHRLPAAGTRVARGVLGFIMEWEARQGFLGASLPLVAGRTRCAGRLQFPTGW